MASTTTTASTRGSGQITAINVTPLVDVMLVLLVIFMATSNYITHPAIEVDLPHASDGSEPERTPIALVLHRGGRITLNGDDASAEAIAAHCKQQSAARPDVQATIAADGGAYHRQVVALVDLIKRNGVEHFAIQIELAED